MTTTYAPISGMAGLITPTKSTAQSEPARKLVEMREEIRSHILESYVMRSATERTLVELEEVRTEAAQDGWDGYQGNALQPLAYLYAKLFLTTLPTTAPVPEVSADPDGEVSLDWHFGERKALTVSIGPAGRCSFAWMVGQSTFRGADWIEDEIPASIVFALSQLADRGVARVDDALHCEPVRDCLVDFHPRCVQRHRCRD